MRIGYALRTAKAIDRPDLVERINKAIESDDTDTMNQKELENVDAVLSEIVPNYKGHQHIRK